MRMRPWLALLGAALMAAPAAAKEIYPGPYRAEVVKVIDSDTIRARVHIWPGQTVETAVRLFGVDTPEKFRPRCAREKALALKATAFVRELVRPGDMIRLRAVRRGKYAGRVVARVGLTNANGDEVRLGQMLIDHGFARPYFGGTKTGWCKEDRKDGRD